MFGLSAGTPVDVLVPLDGFAHFQVQYNGVTVVPLRHQLLIQLGTPTLDALGTGLHAMAKAISALPQTPLKASGINLRYVAASPPDALVERTRNTSERLLSEAGYELLVRRPGQSVAFEGGTLNIIAEIPTNGECRVTVNFERQATRGDDLLDWLRFDPARYIEEAGKVIKLLTE